MVTKQAIEDYAPRSAFVFPPDNFVRAVESASKKAKADNPVLIHDTRPFGVKPSFGKLVNRPISPFCGKGTARRKKLTRLITEGPQLNLLMEI